ncbi:MAG TPA: molybdenum cofactor carrier [Chlorobaculum parvum]|uniref:Molybdenum cofactor carrier n=1 Tax=Chlorobaculum parvum TaxID=274539 RepID=A0A7C5HK90_9CHLB|nr:molybdenum cofactor carrier [Chlorobaculum parvum]
MLMITRIVSGGQTGVDRGALDAAIEAGLEHGGWCPRGRHAEDGAIPQRYRLAETPSPRYEVRTEWNVRDSDGTLVLASGPVSGGTKLTVECARKYARPCMIVDLRENADAEAVAEWIGENGIEVLNVAGPRASDAPGIGEMARRFVLEVTARDTSRTPASS